MSGENTHVVSRMTVGVSDKTRLFNEWNRSCVSPSPRSCCSSVVFHHRQTPWNCFRNCNRSAISLANRPATRPSVTVAMVAEHLPHVGCRSHSCGCRTAPAPTMIGGSSLGVPFSIWLISDEIHYSRTFIPACRKTIRPSRKSGLFVYKYSERCALRQRFFGVNGTPRLRQRLFPLRTGAGKDPLQWQRLCRAIVPFSYGPESLIPISSRIARFRCGTAEHCLSA